MSLRHLLPLLLAGASAAALGLAWFSEYVWGWEPCLLCSWQRLPHLLAVPLLLGAALLNGRDRGAARLLLALAVLVYVGSVGLAAYHVGVEQGWWRAAVSCAASVDLAADATAADFLAQISGQAPVACDAPTLLAFGLSMAFFNLLASLVLLAASAWLVVEALNLRTRSV